MTFQEREVFIGIFFCCLHKAILGTLKMEKNTLKIN